MKPWRIGRRSGRSETRQNNDRRRRADMYKCHGHLSSMATHPITCFILDTLNRPLYLKLLHAWLPWSTYFLQSSLPVLQETLLHAIGNNWIVATLEMVVGGVFSAVISSSFLDKQFLISTHDLHYQLQGLWWPLSSIQPSHRNVVSDLVCCHNNRLIKLKFHRSQFAHQMPILLFNPVIIYYSGYIGKTWKPTLKVSLHHRELSPPMKLCHCLSAPRSSNFYFNTFTLSAHRIWNRSHSRHSPILLKHQKKYQVFGAMEICRLLMRYVNDYIHSNISTDSHCRNAYKDHPFEVFLHATRHEYPELMDIAQARALELSPVYAFDLFPPAVYIAFVSGSDNGRFWIIVNSLSRRDIMPSG